MGAVIAWVLLLAFIGGQLAAISVAKVARDGWQGWRHFWL